MPISCIVTVLTAAALMTGPEATTAEPPSLPTCGARAGAHAVWLRQQGFNAQAAKNVGLAIEEDCRLATSGH